ncbi:nucleotide-binding universal stress UspA family protein [Catalinimonas alkaloidigena]|uniref:universal stress protein n=1 Tax=Catalinimonas alkaloidigena TaxID=1075417 RepID=UPI002406BB7D|nr:universal stress protein [Catalinimonas alkaloidigena]MDF9800117.1 nucleotide-binding universal stress UspA family protein [Catalinimonas alkaloidigena]
MMKNILVAVDFDERTFFLVDYAAELAKKFDAKIWIVHIAAPEPDFVGYDVGPQYIRDSRADTLKGEHKSLKLLTDKLHQQSIEADALLISGPTVQMILDEAKKLQADLIITGSHAHSFLYNAFVGSVSLALFKKSKIPLLTVPLGGDDE